MIGDEQNPDLDFEKIARRLGQNDPQASRWESPANENAPRKSLGFRQRLWNSGIAPVLGLWVGLGYPAACLALLWDGHHPWMNRHPWLALIAMGSFAGPLIIVGWMYRRW
jgi:hypothetical protein